MIKNTSNPIRDIVDQIKLEPNDDYNMIPLSIGDPSVFGNFNPPKEATEAVIRAVTDGNTNGYGKSIGTTEARQAVAEYVKQFLLYTPEIENIAL